MVNHTLDYYAGSETFTYALAGELHRLGHEVICFSPRVGKLADHLVPQGIAVTDGLGTVPGDIDVIHAHHRHESLLAFARFPDTPMIFVCHGVLPWQEQPFRSRLNIHRYVAVSEEVRNHLARSHHIDGGDVTILRNGIDLRRFTSRRPISRPRPRHALILSNYMSDSHRGLIRRACRELGMTVAEVGLRGRARALWAVEEEINRADLVFALGRGALEAMACRRVVIVFDYNGADGLVTPENFRLFRRRNFSGRTHRRQYSEESLREEIERYDPAIPEAVYRLVESEHDLRTMADRFVALYQDAVEQPLWGRPGPEELALRQYRAATELVGDSNSLRSLVEAREQTIRTMQDSRGWRVLAALRRIRNAVVGGFRSPRRAAARPSRILVVDDDPLLTQWLVQALTTDGHAVDTAPNGRIALDRLQSGSYDLILSDLRMPELDGIGLYRRLERERPQLARQIVFLTGNAEDSEYREFLAEVGDRMVTKPVDLVDLERLLQQSLGARAE